MGSESSHSRYPWRGHSSFFIRHRERPCRQAHIRVAIHKLVPLAS